MKHRWPLVALVVALALFFFASCSLTPNRTTDQTLSGRMLLWHALDNSQAQALDQVISSFTELHPATTVKVQVFSTTVELNQQFINASNTGLGPDMIIAPSAWVQPLAASKLIAPIDTQLNEGVVARYNPAIFSMLQVEEQSYGLPLSLDTMGVYVNKQLVENPATSLAELLEQANADTGVLIPINFTDAFWGIQAFGGQLFNEDGQAILDQGGFANWLAWLRDARNAPGMIQDTNRDLLRQRFLAGEAGYYMGYASELNEIMAALGAENVAVMPQPNGPVGPAGPFVSSQAFLFNTSSSRNQRLLATELAKFVTNAEQSSRLMRQVRAVPANANVRINPRLFPLVAAFATQARNGIPYPTNPEFAAVVRLGNEAYVRTLEGGESPSEVAFAINNSINEANGFATLSQPTYACNGLGTLTLAHTWQQPEQLDALDQLVARFRDQCPLIIVEPQRILLSTLARQFSVDAEESNLTLALVTQEQLATLLASEAQLRNLSNLISADLLQRFSPIAIEAMRSQGALYGLPLALHTDALYYNRQLVPAPAQTLDDLRSQAMSGMPIVLDVRFERAFWGVRAFGGQLFAADGAALLDQGGLAEWLAWLVESRDNYGIQLSDDGDDLLRRFANGESAYYVGGAEMFTTLQETLGDNLGVALLPSGPAGTAQPLVRVDGFVLRRDASQAQQELALEFMSFATDIASESLLMTAAGMVPANANVSTADAPYMDVFVQQAQTGFLQPTTPYWQPVVQLGREAYADVLENGLNVSEVVSELTAAINRANGIVVTPTPTPIPPSADVLREDQQPDTETGSNTDASEDSGESGEATPTPAP